MTEFVDFQQIKVGWLTLALSSPRLLIPIFSIQLDCGSCEVDVVAFLIATSTEFVFDSFIFNKSTCQSDTI